MDLGKRQTDTHTRTHTGTKQREREKSSMSKPWHRKRFVLSLCSMALTRLEKKWANSGVRGKPKITSSSIEENREQSEKKLLRFSSQQTAAREREKSYARLFMCMCVRVRVVYAFRRKKNYKQKKKM